MRVVGFRSSIFAAQREQPRVTPIQSQGSRPPIYLIHDLAGHIDCYRNLASALGPDQPVYALCFVSDPQAFQTLDELASSYLADLRAFDPAGPYILGGFSFGGAVAFEMARQLEEMGQPGPLVLMIDAWIGGADRKLRSSEQLSILWQKTREQGIAFLAVKVRNRLVSLIEKTQHLFFNLAGKICHRFHLQPPSRVRMALLEKANLRLLLAYEPRLYRGPVLLVASSRKLDFLRKRGDHFFGWDVLAGQRFEISAVDAEHMSIMEEPAIREVARRIQQKLTA